MDKLVYVTIHNGEYKLVIMDKKLNILFTKNIVYGEYCLLISQGFGSIKI